MTNGVVADLEFDLRQQGSEFFIFTIFLTFLICVSLLSIQFLMPQSALRRDAISVSLRILASDLAAISARVFRLLGPNRVAMREDSQF